MQELSDFVPKNLGLWEKPSDFSTSEHDLGDHYVIYSQNRDSNLLTKSNWDYIVKSLDSHECDYQGDEFYRISHFRDSFVGWSEYIFIHKDHTDLLIIADEIMGRYADYPVLDDEDYSQREFEQFESNVKETVESFCKNGERNVDWSNKEYFEDYFVLKDSLAAEVSKRLELIGRGVGYYESNYPRDSDIEDVLWDIGIWNNTNVLITQAEGIAESMQHYLSNWDYERSVHSKRLQNLELFSLKAENEEIEEEFISVNNYCLSCKGSIYVDTIERKFSGNILSERCI